jgi:hypothetical protein
MKQWCCLCGVSFDIGRFRIAEEPPESGWTINQRQYDTLTPLNPYKVDDGCFLDNPLSTINGLDGDLDDAKYKEDDDSDWREEEGSEYEEYEFESDDDDDLVRSNSKPKIEERDTSGNDTQSR